MGRGISQWDKDFEQKTDREKEIALEKRMSHEKTVAIEFIEGMKGFITGLAGKISKEQTEPGTVAPVLSLRAL